MMPSIASAKASGFRSALRQCTPWTNHSALPQVCDINGTQPRHEASRGAKANGSRGQVGKAKTS